MEKPVVLAKDAPHSRIGQVLACLSAGEAGVTSDHLQQNVVNNPVQRAMVITAMRGDLTLGMPSFADILEREASIVGSFCRMAGLSYPPLRQIEKALCLAEATRDFVSVNDRFIPGGIGLEQAFQFLYNWNAEQIKQGGIPLKLYNEIGKVGKEWWRTDKDVEFIPTQAGILTCDFGAVSRSDMAGRPFNLTLDDQIAWAKDQGGDGITSIEELVYLFIRSIIECRLTLWGGGSMKCRNACGSGYSLGVHWVAGGGFDVGLWRRSVQDWDLGAVARKFLALGS